MHRVNVSLYEHFIYSVDSVEVLSLIHR